jgi:hypothetical protein
MTVRTEKLRKQNNKIGLAIPLLCLLFVAVPAVAFQGWTKWAPAGEGFSVQLPSKPEEQTTKVPILGSDYLMKMYTEVDESNRVMYLVVMQEFPRSVGMLTPSERLDNFMDGFKSGFVKELTTTCPDVELHQDGELTLKNRTGRQYSLNCKSVPGLIRVYETEARIYVLLAMGRNEKDDGVAQFLQSFEILPAPAPVPQVTSESKAAVNP